MENFLRNFSRCLGVTEPELEPISESRCFLCHDQDPSHLNPLEQRFLSDPNTDRSVMPGIPQAVVDSVLCKLLELEKIPDPAGLSSPPGKFCISCASKFFHTIQIFRQGGEENRSNRRRLQKILFSRLEAQIFTYINGLRLKGTKNSDDIDEFEQFLLRGLIYHGMETLRTLSFDACVWTSMHEHSRSLLLDLMRLCALDTISVEVCCSTFAFPLDFFSDVTGLKHLRITQSPACYHLEGVSANYHAPSALQQQTRENVFIESLFLQGLGAKMMVEYLQVPETDRPIKMSKLRGLRLGGPEEWDVSTMSQLLQLGVDSIQSIVWDSPGQWDDWMRLDPEKIKLNGLNLRHLTLKHSRKFGIRRTFSILSSHLGVPVTHLEVLNIICPVPLQYTSTETDPDNFWFASLKRTVKKVDDDFKLQLGNEQAFPNLKHIRLFLIYVEFAARSSVYYPTPPWNEWISSNEWPLSPKCAPSMHETKVLSLRTGSVHEAEVYLERALRMEDSFPTAQDVHFVQGGDEDHSYSGSQDQFSPVYSR